MGTRTARLPSGEGTAPAVESTVWRIAIDARELQGKPTGVGRFLSAVIGEWNNSPATRTHEFILCTPKPGESSGLAWEQMTLPRLVRAARAQVLFAPGYTMASLIANEFSEATNDLHLSALMAVGAALFMITLIVNAVARWLVWSVSRSRAR